MTSDRVFAASFGSTVRPLRRITVVFMLAAAACGGPTATPSAPPSPVAPSASSQISPTVAPSPTVPPNADAAGVVWLCMPGRPDDACTGDLSTTVLDSGGHATISKLATAKDPPIDCFYVYPTTSRQAGANADLSIDPEETAVAAAQAALFSQVCKVYAPIYPQLTVAAISGRAPTRDQIDLAHGGVRAAFADYLANYNHGRGIVFIGHSQGAMMLSELLRREVDPKPEIRKLLVSALLMGGNVTVTVGQTTGGQFRNIPACRNAVETGCVVAYSSFSETPPAGAGFGRASSALSMFAYSTTGKQETLCVNPASPPGGIAALKPYFVTADVAGMAGAPIPAPTTPYVSYVGVFSGQCLTSGDATWLLVTRSGSATAAPTIVGPDGPTWGLHHWDVGLTLGNSIDLVRTESAAFK
jgi:hypothetical protein